jgi:L-threonylcarbamoyladenylate synthase
MLIDFDKSVDALLNNEVLAYPTEAVFGLGCRISCDEAIKQIFELKKRSKNKGLIIIGDSFDMLKPYCGFLSKEQEQILLNTWPGAVTFLVQPSQKVSQIITGSFTKIAIRVPDHKIARLLTTKIKEPIISTSANISGQTSQTKSASINKDFPNIKVLDDVVGSYTKPSTIIDLDTKQIIRA